MGYSLALLALAAGVAHAQYPTRAIHLVVPYSAGSDADLSARNLAQHVPRYLGGQPIVVQNQPGASGAIGTQAVREAPADGYTLLLARIASHVIQPATDPKTPYRWSDFTQISLLELNPYICAVKRESAYRSMPDLIGAMRERPGKLNFATVGAGTIQNFGPQYLFSLIGLPRDAAIGVPYKGSGELTTALIAGQVDFACSNLGALLGQLKSGTVRALMTTMPQPLPELPEVPTARSLGWPQMENIVAWSALAGPRGLPAEVMQRWMEAMSQLARDAGWLAGNEKLGGVPAVRTPAETDAFVRAQFQMYETLAGRLGLRQ